LKKQAVMKVAAAAAVANVEYAFELEDLPMEVGTLSSAPKNRRDQSVAWL